MAVRRYAPGVALATALATLATLLQALESRWLRQPILESLVLAILLGMLCANVLFRRAPAVQRQTWPGLGLCAKQVLEVAVLLLGATMNLRQLFAGGPRLLFGVTLSTLLALAVSSVLSRRIFGLPRKPATLIAVGNSICGNSAIAAVAPLIGASSADVAGSVAFTAVLGVGLVIGLPLLCLPLLHFSDGQYGVLVGMTVYAVPQVLAASYPVSELAGQTATLVKLTRVLLLAPVALYYSLRPAREAAARADEKQETAVPVPRRRADLGKLIPWFIVGFLILALLRTLGLFPDRAAAACKEVARLLTVVAMAALGLGVDLRALRATGARTAGAVLLSLAFLLVESVLVIKLLGLS
jgi:uncharacterized integral membrane protein (TIGR00698 family)